MFNYLKRLFSENQVSLGTIKDAEGSKLQVATCALFIEVAKADEEFSSGELKLIKDIMTAEFKLTESEIDELFSLAKKKMNQSVSLYEYTDEINKYYTKEEKYEILKNLWRLILIDGKLNAHEEYFVRTISRNLNLEHKELISSKLEIKNEFGIN